MKTENIESKACHRKGPQQPEGVHVAENIDLSMHQHQHSNGDTRRQSNRSVRRATEAVALENEFGEELHTGKGQENMVRPDQRSIAGKGQDQPGTDGHLCLQDEVAPVFTQQRAKRGATRGIW